MFTTDVWKVKLAVCLKCPFKLLSVYRSCLVCLNRGNNSEACAASCLQKHQLTWNQEIGKHNYCTWAHLSIHYCNFRGDEKKKIRSEIYHITVKLAIFSARRKRQPEDGCIVIESMQMSQWENLPEVQTASSQHLNCWFEIFDDESLALQLFKPTVFFIWNVIMFYLFIFKGPKCYHAQSWSPTWVEIQKNCIKSNIILL